MEAPELWREGAATFFSDAASRLVFGAFVGIFSASPYLLLTAGARRTGPALLFTSTSVVLFVLQMWLSIEAVFFSQSSTGAIGLLFMPLYALVLAAVVWATAAVARRVRSHQGSNPAPR
jgi:hypothetical protein